MNELSPRARLAIEAMQEDTGSEDHRACVRERLAALGICVSAAGAASAASAPAAIASAGSPGLGAPPAAAATSAAGTQAAATGAVLSAGSAKAVTFSGSGALAKLSALGVGTKVTATLIVLAGAGALHVALPAPRHQSTESAAHAREQPRTARSAAATGANQLEAPAAVESKARPAEPASRLLERSAPRRLARGKTGERPRGAADARSSLNLEAESALMAAALKALRAGQTERARFLCDVHERDFGTHALLARERERMRRDLAQTLR